MKDEQDRISLPKDVAEVLFSAAEARWEQYDRFARGLDPYGSDCIYECDASEAADLAAMYKRATNTYISIDGSGT